MDTFLTTSCGEEEVVRLRRCRSTEAAPAGSHSHLGELGSGSAGHFGHPELGQLVLQVIQLFEQLLLLLAPQISCLDLGLKSDGEKTC